MEFFFPFSNNNGLYRFEKLWDRIVLLTTDVVYFDKPLGAVHSQCWFKSAFPIVFFVQKTEKRKKNKKIEAKLSNETFLFELAPKRWSKVHDYSSAS